ncbi:hypothetical protein [Scytonema sp. NUACC26]|uniref:hypothetical protein n=1 Tax=Scytonema sp. NUACC26 TaxID=3140176 RepID=UPI0034DC5051
MEIFINEVSLEGQYITEAEFRDAIKNFISIFELINQKIKDKKLYKDDSNIYANYEAIKGSNFNASLNQIKDKSLRVAFINIVFNKLNPKEWRQEQIHSSEDLFDCLTIDNDYKNVSNTSLAEIAERKLQNHKQEYLIINFINSSFRIPHPDISNSCLITIIKNNDEIYQICLDGVESKLALEFWLKHKLHLSQLEYSLNTTESPRDEQTVLLNVKRFKKTSFRYDGRFIYCELTTGRYWYIDNLHYGKAAHLEVFDKTGKQHLGEADLEGNIDYSKSDPNKTIDIS